jgi:hypothetical protein
MRIAILFLIAACGALGLDNGVRVYNDTAAEQTRRPFSISRWFAQGEITQYPQAFVDGTAATTQADVKVRWPDGSVRHAIVSFRATVPPSSSAYVDFRNQAIGNNSGFLNESGMLNFRSADWGCAIETVASGVTLGADCRAMLADFNDSETPYSGSFYWLKGSVATQIILRSKAGAYDWSYRCGSKCFATVTVDSATDVLTSTVHGLADGDQVYLGAAGSFPSQPGGTSASTYYFVRDATADTFKLALTNGGAAVNITSNGSSPLMWYRPYSAWNWAQQTTPSSKSLSPTFVVTFYPALTGGDTEFVRVEAIVENCWVQKLQDQFYNLSVKTGNPGATSYTRNNVIHNAMTRLRWTGWSGPAPGGWVNELDQGVHVDYNLPYMVYGRNILPLDLNRTVGSAALASELSGFQASDQGDMPSPSAAGSAQWGRNWLATGGSPDIGIMTRWYARYLYRMDSRDAWKFFLGNARAAGHIPYHIREDDPGKPFDHLSTNGQGWPVTVNGRPNLIHALSSDTSSNPMRIVPGMLVKVNQGTSWLGAEYSIYPVWCNAASSDGDGRKWALKPNHWRDLAWVPYLITGDFYFLEEVWFGGLWSLNIAGYQRGPLFSDGYLSAVSQTGGANHEVRGAAWATRQLIFAAMVSPDGTPRTYFQEKLNVQIHILEGKLQITNGSFPPADPTCAGGVNSSRWCWGRDAMDDYRMSTTNPLGMLWFSFNGMNIDNIASTGTMAKRNQVFEMAFWFQTMGAGVYLGLEQMIPMVKTNFAYPVHLTTSYSEFNPFMIGSKQWQTASTADASHPDSYCRSNPCPFRTVADMHTNNRVDNTGQPCAFSPAGIPIRDGNEFVCGDNALFGIDYNYAQMHWYLAYPEYFDWDYGGGHTGSKGAEWYRANIPYQNQYGSGLSSCSGISGGNDNCDNPRWSLDGRRITNVRKSGNEVLFTAPNGGACSWALDPFSSLDSADTAIPAGGRNRGIDVTGLSGVIRVTCGSSRATLPI